MKDLDLYGWIALILVIIGGINWGLVGLVNLNLITSILGEIISRLIFVVVGVSAGYLCYLMYLGKIKKA